MSQCELNQHLAQDVLENAAVAVVVDLLGGVDTDDGVERLLLAVGRFGVDRGFLARRERRYAFDVEDLVAGQA